MGPCAAVRGHSRPSYDTSSITGYTSIPSALAAPHQQPNAAAAADSAAASFMYCPVSPGSSAGAHDSWQKPCYLPADHELLRRESSSASSLRPLAAKIQQELRSQQCSCPVVTAVHTAAAAAVGLHSPSAAAPASPGTPGSPSPAAAAVDQQISRTPRLNQYWRQRYIYPAAVAAAAAVPTQPSVPYAPVVYSTQSPPPSPPPAAATAAAAATGAAECSDLMTLADTAVACQQHETHQPAVNALHESPLLPAPVAALPAAAAVTSRKQSRPPPELMRPAAATGDDDTQQECSEDIYFRCCQFSAAAAVAEPPAGAASAQHTAAAAAGAPRALAQVQQRLLQELHQSPLLAVLLQRLLKRRKEQQQQQQQQQQRQGSTADGTDYAVIMPGVLNRDQDKTAAVAAAGSSGSSSKQYRAVKLNRTSYVELPAGCLLVGPVSGVAPAAAAALAPSCRAPAVDALQQQPRAPDGLSKCSVQIQQHAQQVEPAMPAYAGHATAIPAAAAAPRQQLADVQKSESAAAAAAPGRIVPANNVQALQQQQQRADSISPSVAVEQQQQHDLLWQLLRQFKRGSTVGSGNTHTVSAAVDRSATHRHAASLLGKRPNLEPADQLVTAAGQQQQSGGVKHCAARGCTSSSSGPVPHGTGVARQHGFQQQQLAAKATACMGAGLARMNSPTSGGCSSSRQFTAMSMPLTAAATIAAPPIGMTLSHLPPPQQQLQQHQKKARLQQPARLPCSYPR